MVAVAHDTSQYEPENVSAPFPTRQRIYLRKSEYVLSIKSNYSLALYSMKNKLGLIIAGSTMLGFLLIGGTALAATPSVTTSVGASAHWGMGGKMPGVFGTVSAISGDTLTVTSRAFTPRNPTTTSNAPAVTTYTVDATNATVTKNGSASTLASVAVGDMVMIQGTVSGTNVAATTIHDGIMGGMGRGMGGKPGQHATSTTPIIQGNGEPVVGGSVTAVSGSTLTVTTAKGGLTYNIDASAATVQKGGKAASVSSVVVGDNVVVQGAVNGTSVTASSVIDQGAPRAAGSAPNKGIVGGFMGAVGGFFQHLFGFF
jgi:hypothetical protein